MERYSRASADIVAILETLKVQGDILDFRHENQLQHDLVALYILGDKARLPGINAALHAAMLQAIGTSSLSVNILYNYVEDGVLYDAEFLQGFDEIKRGYSVSKFGQFAEPSEIDEDFYKLTSKR